MRVLITDTEDIEELEVTIGRKDGNTPDLARDLVLCANNYKYDVDNDAYIMDKTDYAWWMEFLKTITMTNISLVSFINNTTMIRLTKEMILFKRFFVK